MKYKPLSHVLNYLPSYIIDIEDDIDQFRSWALQYLRKMNIPSRFTTDLCLLAVEDHKASLPSDLKKIRKIKYVSDNLDAEAYSSLQQCVVMSTENDTSQYVNTEITETTTTVGNQTIETKKTVHYSDHDACSLNKSLFTASVFYNEYCYPMKFIGRTGADYFTKSCYNDIAGTRSCAINEFSIKDDCLLTEFKEGLVCIEYQTEVKDENGEILVPEGPEVLWDALAANITAKYYENKAVENPQMLKQAEYFANKARNYKREALGISKLKNLDPKQLLEIQNHEMRFIQLPLTWSNKISV